MATLIRSTAGTGSLVMYPIYTYGSEQKEISLKLATSELMGCLVLLTDHGSNRMTTNIKDI